MRHLSEWKKVRVDGMTHIDARATDDRSSWYGAVGNTSIHTGNVDRRRLPAGPVGRGSGWEDGVDGQRVQLEEEYWGRGPKVSGV